MVSGAAQYAGMLADGREVLVRRALQERIFLPVVCCVGLFLSVCSNWLFPGLGIAVCIVTVATVLLLSVTRSIELVVFAFLFQNIMIAVIGGAVGTFDGATIAKATNFLLCVTLWAMCLVLHLRYPPDDDSAFLMKISFVILAIIGVYFVYGVAKNGSSAISYLRNLIIPIACLHIALTTSRFGGGGTHYPTWIAYALLAYCYLEIAMGVEFLQTVNVDTYLTLGQDAAAPMDERFTVALFNTNIFGDLGTLHRLLGPNIHPISLAYAIATFALLCFIQKRYLQVLLFLPLFVFAGSKGSIAYFLFTSTAILAARHLNPRIVLFTATCLSAAYAIFLFKVGQGAGDFHVLGLVGSLKGFLANPLGYGIGAGGNLNISFELEDWERFQHQGYTDTALETAIGVVLYQLGVAGIAVLAFYAYIARFFWKRFLVSRDPMHAFGTFSTMFIVTNSLFQEEALFAPLCLGLALLFAASGPFADRTAQTPNPSS